MRYREIIAKPNRKKFLITFDDPDPSNAPDYKATSKTLEDAGYEVAEFNDGPETTIMCSCTSDTVIANIQSALEPLFRNDQGTVIVAEVGNAYLWPEADTSPRQWRRIGD